MFVERAGSASILHADLDSFYASVEQRDDPTLRGRPVAAGSGGVRAASYEARRHGVRTAMPTTEARRRCPELVVVPARFDAYAEASAAVFDVFERTTPVVEGISIDEAFLDVSGLRRISGPPVEIARALRRRVRDEVGLPITVGVARTKFLAKVASGVGKPDGLLVVEPDEELAFLHPLAVDRLWGVGRITADKLSARGLHTVGDVAALDVEVLCGLVGRAAGRQLHALSHARDARRVETGRRRGSIGSQQALGRRERSRAEIDDVLLRLVDRVTRRLRRSGRSGRTVTIRFRFDDFGRMTRSHTLSQPTSATGPILSVAAALLDAAWSTCAERGLTLIGVSVGQLGDADTMQLVFPFERATSDAVDVVVDDVRQRFGSGSLTRGSSIGFDPEHGPPLLPD
ncbi:MAG: DNA polymerase IV [Actinomycetota bacterium]